MRSNQLTRRLARIAVGTGLAAGLSFSAASALAAPSGPGGIALPSTTVTTAKPPCDPKLASCDITSKPTVTTAPKPCADPGDCFTTPTTRPDDPDPTDPPGTSDPHGNDDVASVAVDTPVRANPTFTG